MHDDPTRPLPDQAREEIHLHDHSATAKDVAKAIIAITLAAAGAVAAIIAAFNMSYGVLLAIGGVLVIAAGAMYTER